MITVQTSLKMTRFDWIEKDIWKRRGLPVPSSRMSLPVFCCLFNSSPCGVATPPSSSPMNPIYCNSLLFLPVWICQSPKTIEFKGYPFNSTLAYPHTHTHTHTYKQQSQIVLHAHTYCLFRRLCALPFWPPPLPPYCRFRLAHSSFFLLFVCLLFSSFSLSPLCCDLPPPPTPQRRRIRSKLFFLLQQATGKVKQIKTPSCHSLPKRCFIWPLVWWTSALGPRRLRRLQQQQQQ